MTTTPTDFLTDFLLERRARIEALRADQPHETEAQAMQWLGFNLAIDKVLAILALTTEQPEPGRLGAGAVRVTGWRFACLDCGQFVASTDVAEPCDSHALMGRCRRHGMTPVRITPVRWDAEVES